MKKRSTLYPFLILFSLIFITDSAISQSVGINNPTPDPTAALDIMSNDKGVLIPRVTTAQRVAIGGGSPAPGLLVYDTNTKSFQYYNGSGWTNLSGGADTDWVETPTTVTTTRKVGIGTTTPEEELDIVSNTSNDGATLRLANNGQGHFLRLFSGRDAFQTPLIYWNQGDELIMARANADDSNYQPFLGLNGKTMNVYNTGRSIHLGENAGTNDDGTDNGNVNIGYLAATNNSTGARNVMLGYRAGLNSTTVSNSVFIGSEAGFSESRNHTLVIENTGSASPLIYGEFDNDMLRVNGRMEVTGKLTLGNDATPDVTGMIRWNPVKLDFEGFNGNDWVSFTSGGIWGETPSNNIESDAVSGPFASVPNQFGNSIAIDGGLMVVGNPQINIFPTGDPSLNGQVELYEKLNGEWNLIQTLTAPDGQAGSAFGTSVDIVGTQILIGAPRHDVGGNMEQGKVYVFDLVTTVWAHVYSLLASDGTANDFFGHSVKASGNRVIVGAPEARPFAGVPLLYGSGNAYIFEKSGSVWTETFNIDHGGANGDIYGWSVSIDGDHAVVGAPLKTVFGFANRGRIYAYKKTGSVWAESDNMWSSGGSAGDLFGLEVDISGTTIVASAPNKNIAGNAGQGNIYGFTFDGSDWDQTASFTIPEPFAGAELGSKLRLKNGVLAARSAYPSAGGTEPGLLLVYAMNGNTFTLQSSIVSSEGSILNSVDIGTDVIVTAARTPSNHIFFFEN